MKLSNGQKGGYVIHRALQAKNKSLKESLHHTREKVAKKSLILLAQVAFE
jgi:hypothetical protein